MRYIGGYDEGGCVFMCRGVCIPQGAYLSDWCVGFVGGVIVVEACGTVCATLVGGPYVSIVSYPVGVCCFPYARLSWRCGAMVASGFCDR